LQVNFQKRAGLKSPAPQKIKNRGLIMNTETFAERLKTARNNANLTQAALSKNMEIPPRTVEAWEMGERKPPVYVQKLILQALEQLREGIL